MSLATDSILIAAIKSDDDIMERIGNRIYSTAIPLPDEDADNVPTPYIIVSFDGLNNDQTTKDDPYESGTDIVNVSVEIVAGSRPELAKLAMDVRSVIHSYFLNEYTQVEGYNFSSDAVNYDQFKPCYWQVLRYQCDVTEQKKWEQLKDRISD